MFAPLAKGAEQIDAPDRLSEAMTGAFAQALGGRMGPIVLALPEDVLSADTHAPAVPPLPVDPCLPDPERIKALESMLAAAERPVLLLGGSGWTDNARADILVFVTSHRLPVCCGFRRHDLVPNDDACFIGEFESAPIRRWSGASAKPTC